MLFILRALPFLRILIGSLGTITTDIILPIIQLTKTIRKAVEKKQPIDWELVKGIIGKKLFDKIKKRLPATIKSLGIPLPKDAKDEEVIVAFIEYMQTIPDNLRGALYLKLASKLLQDIEKVKEAEADTLIQLTYLRDKIDSPALVATEEEEEESEEESE